MVALAQQDPDLIPARMVNEYVYCPRLCWLEWIDGEWAENPDTLDGTYRHRRADIPEGDIGSPAGPGAPEPAPEESAFLAKARAVEMSATAYGFIAKMDLVEEQAGVATPIDTKRGKAPDLSGGAWDADRVQICVQALILRENGYICDLGHVYYASSRKRVPVPITPELITKTLDIRDKMRAMAGPGDTIPPPLQDSPKCPRCSLVGICLPDETNAVRAGAVPAHDDTVRRLVPARDDAQPLYVQNQRAAIGKTGDEVVIREKGNTLETVRLIETSQICLFGNPQITTQAVHACLERDIPVLSFTYGGWFRGRTVSLPPKNVALRKAQYAATQDPELILQLSRDFVRVKILNCRTLLRRNLDPAPPGPLEEMKRLAEKTTQAESLESLLGFEGSAARIYFAHFGAMLKAPQPQDNPSAQEWSDFTFEGRNRRPPKDPVNAMLSFAYALLTKDWTIAIDAVGLDPMLGFYHQCRHGRPALALDMMEPFRPLIADSTVLGAINNGIIAPKDFIRRAGAVALSNDARKKFILVYERRMDTLITHPVFDYRISYRRVLEVQTRLLARRLTGEIDAFPDFLTR